MAVEIERKFLVNKGVNLEDLGTPVRITQGYLSSVAERAVRVRIYGDSGFLTIKGISSNSGMSRFEFEKEISKEDALSLLEICEPGAIDKTRTVVKVGKHKFEVDRFLGENEGLVVAEIELSSEDEEFEKPEWLGEEVTGDPKYYNANLSKLPYKSWK